MPSLEKISKIYLNIIKLLIEIRKMTKLQLLLMMIYKHYLPQSINPLSKLVSNKLRSSNK
jgi:hypothetical protein